MNGDGMSSVIAKLTDPSRHMESLDAMPHKAQSKATGKTLQSMHASLSLYCQQRMIELKQSIHELKILNKFQGNFNSDWAPGEKRRLGLPYCISLVLP